MIAGHLDMQSLSIDWTVSINGHLFIRSWLDARPDWLVTIDSTPDTLTELIQRGVPEVRLSTLVLLRHLWLQYGNKPRPLSPVLVGFLQRLNEGNN